MDNRLKHVISSLLAGTNSRRLNWQSGDRRNEYRLKLDHGIINVDVWDDEDPFGPGPPEEIVDITFFNTEGVEVDRYFFSKQAQKESFNELVALHDAARRNCLKIDETLSGLFAEIEEKASGKSD